MAKLNLLLEDRRLGLQIFLPYMAVNRRLGVYVTFSRQAYETPVSIRTESF